MTQQDVLDIIVRVSEIETELDQVERIGKISNMTSFLIAWRKND